MRRPGKSLPPPTDRRVWLKAYEDARNCTLREVRLDGSEKRGPRPVACSARLVDAGSGAVLVDGGSVRDPDTGETLVEVKELWAIVGDFAITTEGLRGRLR